MTIEVFTPDWVDAWAAELRASEAYRKAASTWEGSVVLEMTADSTMGLDEERKVFLDLWHGDCRDARLATEEDHAAAKIVLRATPEEWKRILEGKVEPLLSLMSGKLKLARGQLSDLMPYVEASRQLVVSATRVGSHFPGEA